MNRDRVFNILSADFLVNPDAADFCPPRHAGRNVSVFLDPSLDGWIRAALREDIGSGDLTTEAVVPAGLHGRAEILAKERCVPAGIDVALRVFDLLSDEVKAVVRAVEGSWVDGGRVLVEVEGPVRVLLTAERVALNLLQHLSGIATLTRRFVEAVDGTGVRILDTRKTLAGWRRLEKYAVRVGGGGNHRSTLSEGILIKENHIRAAGGLLGAVRAARGAVPHLLRVEVEVTSLEEVREALEAGVDAILLDNMPTEMFREAVRIVGGAVTLEASGGITLGNVREVAETGVDAVSIGRLTHSAPAADISMLLKSG